MIGRCCILLVTVAGHGTVTDPKPRQAIDGTISPWNGTIPDPIPFDAPNWCESPSAASTDPRHLSGKSGQACFWFNNGCDIGCDKCDGVTGQKIPCCNHKFIYNGSGAISPWAGDGIVQDPTWKAKWKAEGVRDAQRPSTVKFPDRKPTICDPKLRTVNIDAECGSEEDFWYYAPWRYPGMAPVTDSCGTAGGVLPGQGQGSAGADYTDTVNAKHGDLGSKLPPLETGTVWKSGSDVNVAWNFKAWHGGGYTYRLASADGPLNEVEFNKMPLQFIGNSSLRWGGVGGEQLSFSPSALGWQVSEGTIPEGSMWRKMPIPRGPWAWSYYGASTEPVCEESEECKNSAKTGKSPGHGAGMCKCSGEWNDRVEFIDTVRIPTNLKPGKYVLGWRWDCEESTQVWTSCSDVTITA